MFFKFSPERKLQGQTFKVNMAPILYKLCQEMKKEEVSHLFYETIVSLIPNLAVLLQKKKKEKEEEGGGRGRRRRRRRGRRRRKRKRTEGIHKKSLNKFNLMHTFSEIC